MKFVVADFETASRADLQKVGAWKYASDFSTIPLCLSLKVAEEINGIVRPQWPFCLSESMLHALDQRLLDLINDPSVMFLAHNAGFEQAMWHYHMVPMGYPALPPERWHDTMATAAMKALPLGLDALVTALELPVKKDMEGHRHMLKMCKPDLNDGWSQHTPENLQRLYDYCNEDVNAQYGAYIATRGLGPAERETWVLDQKINQRGIRIDTNFVDACMDVLDQVRVPMTARFREITGLNPTQREKIVNWVNEQGVALDNMRKATLDGLLDADDEFGLEDLDEILPPLVHEVLTLRRSLASSSVAKLERMLLCAGGDGRVRYTTQYHGARTGRDAGRLIQIQNYPRGEIGDRQGLTADMLADAILTRDIDYIRDIWGPDIFTAVISSLRSCIVPEEGKVIVAGDFAAVECRNLLSMAGQHDRVEQMHSGMDVYSETASMIYKMPINRKLPEFHKQGNIGKQTVLGCLAADTSVLTRNGWKPIVNVEATDLLWDGENWVTHSGLAFKGFKETLNLSGLRMTPEHPVFTGHGWRRADRVKANTLSRALAFAKAHMPLSALPIPKAVASQGSFANAIAETARISWIRITSTLAARQVVANAPALKRIKATAHVRNTTKFARMKCSEKDWFVEYSDLSGAVLTQNLKHIQTTAAEVSALISKTSKSVWRIYSRLKVGKTLPWKLTVLTPMGTTKWEIFDLPQVTKTEKPNAQLGVCKPNWMWPSKKSTCCEPVYDLVNAGPKHRFTVMTDAGPLIVHNSGYGLGPVGFHNRFAPKESFELAQLAIDTYRKDFAPRVPVFWYGLYKASAEAVWCSQSKTYSYEGIEFRKEENDFLTMRLPSGRKIWYHRPRRDTTYNAYTDTEYPAWTFMSYQGKKFRRHLAWHGMLTADCIQGSARCLLKEAEKRAEAAGLFTIFRVHDELVFEEVDRPDLALTVKQIMEDIAPWARERKFRVKAEVSTMLRYQK